jgi:hypothetical protein
MSGSDVPDVEHLAEPPSREWVARYLALLGVDHAAPGLEALGRLTRAQICTIPFENVTAILRRHSHPRGTVPGRCRRPTPKRCWTTGSAVAAAGPVLSWPRCSAAYSLLGYRAQLVLAQITFPGSHQAVLVELEGERT